MIDFQRDLAEMFDLDAFAKLADYWFVDTNRTLTGMHVLESKPDATLAGLGTQVETTTFLVMTKDVLKPKKDDMITVDGITYTVQFYTHDDEQRLIWRLDVIK